MYEKFIRKHYNHGENLTFLFFSWRLHWVRFRRQACLQCPNCRHVGTVIGSIPTWLARLRTSWSTFKTCTRASPTFSLQHRTTQVQGNSWSFRGPSIVSLVLKGTYLGWLLVWYFICAPKFNNLLEDLQLFAEKVLTNTSLIIFYEDEASEMYVWSKFSCIWEKSKIRLQIS